MQFEGALAVFSFFLTLVLVWGTFLLTRHKERMTMIEKGLRPEEIKALYERHGYRLTPLNTLKWGMVFIAVGLAVLAGMWLQHTYLVEGGVYPALIALLGGIALVAFYALAVRKKAE